jgi:hypothetical protein
MQAYLESLPYGQVGDTARSSLALPCNNGYQLAHPGSGRCRQHRHRLMAVGLGLEDTAETDHGLAHL